MRRLVVTSLALALLAVSAAAQQGMVVRSERLGLPALGEGSGAFAASTNAIIGTVRSADRRPIPEASLRLRHLGSGRVVQETISSAEGQFAFRGIEPGTYVVELTTDDGTVVALSEAITVGSGEVVQTLVQVAARTRTFGWWFGSATASALGTAASLGLLTIEPGAPVSPTTPGRPGS